MARDCGEVFDETAEFAAQAAWALARITPPKMLLICLIQALKDGTTVIGCLDGLLAFGNQERLRRILHGHELDESEASSPGCWSRVDRARPCGEISAHAVAGNEHKIT